MADQFLTMSTGAAFNRGNSKQDVGTPPEFIEAVEKRFGRIGYDLAAVADNCVVKHDNLVGPYFGPDNPPFTDSLAVDWPGNTYGKLCWLNPPFGDITPWARKCAESGAKGVRILFLVPASIGANWYRDYVNPFAYVLAINGRLTFVGHKQSYPKDLVLACYGFGLGPGFDVWTWKTQTTKTPQ